MGANPLTQILADLKISGQMPLEGLATAIVNKIGEGRANMLPDTRDQFDQLQIKILKDTYYIWRNIWVKAGWLPAEEPEVKKEELK